MWPLSFLDKIEKVSNIVSADLTACYKHLYKGFIKNVL